MIQMTIEQAQEVKNMFDSIMHISEDGTVYWTGRELAKMLGYAPDHWDRFENTIQKAVDLMQSQNENIDDHIATSGVKVPIGSGAIRTKNDYILDRYACYCIADSSSAKNALSARAYFISTTMQVEDIMNNANNIDRLNKRTDFSYYRNRLNKQYMSEGVTKPTDFAYIHNQGNIGFFGGKDTQDIRDMCNYPDYKPIEDGMSRDALLFKAVADTGTYYANKNEHPTEVNRMGDIEKDWNSQSRDIMKRFTGLYPEDGIPYPDTKDIQRSIKKDIRNIKKESLSTLLTVQYEINGILHTIPEWCNLNDVDLNYAIDEISNGKDFKDILSEGNGGTTSPIYFV